EEGESLVGVRGTEAGLGGNPAGAAVTDRAAERQALQHAVLVFPPGVEAQPADELRLVGGVGDDVPLAIESAHPVLRDAAFDVAVDGDPGAAKGRGSGRIQHGLHAALDEVQVGSAYRRL